jgi:hypothetical protein
LLVVGRRQLVVLPLSGQTFFGELLVARAQRHHRAPLPLLGVGHFLLVLLGEALLVRDRGCDLFLRLDELVVHVQNDLVQHLLGILRAADEIVQVALDELCETAEDSHASNPVW